jgi:hypothetical protein
VVVTLQSLGSSSPESTLRDIPSKYLNKEGFTCFYHEYRHPLLEIPDLQALYTDSVLFLVFGCISIVIGMSLFVIDLRAVYQFQRYYRKDEIYRISNTNSSLDHEYNENDAAMITLQNSNA